MGAFVPLATERRRRKPMALCGERNSGRGETRPRPSQSFRLNINYGCMIHDSDYFRRRAAEARAAAAANPFGEHAEAANDLARAYAAMAKRRAAAAAVQAAAESGQAAAIPLEA